MKRSLYTLTSGKNKVPEFFDKKFSVNISYFWHYFFNSVYSDMAIKPSFEVQNTALMNVK